MEIRLIESKDAKPFFDLIERNRDRLTAYFPVTTKEVHNIKSAKKFVNFKVEQAYHKELYCFLVFDDAENLVGSVIAKNLDWTVSKCELSYFVDGVYEGKGITSKALDYLIGYCFNSLKMKKLYLRIATENFRSKHLALKKYFQLEGVHKRDFKTGQGKIVDVEYHALFKNKVQDDTGGTDQ